MSRTFPRPAGEMPANCVSRTTRMAAPKDKASFPLQKAQCILAQREAKSMSLLVEKTEFSCERKSFGAGRPAKTEGGESPPLSKNTQQNCSAQAADAAAARLGTGASSPSQRTLTSFETPGSCMVTP